jgi:hypothetical protein
MGLDTTHEAWHGAYSAFHTWRTEIAKQLGIPLDLMEGFYVKGEHDPLSLLNYRYPKGNELDMSHLRRIETNFPLLWDAFKPNPLHELLYHSDCDGLIEREKCNAIADELEKLLPELPDKDFGGHIGLIRDKTKTFIDGLRLAYENQENIEFH